MVGQLLPLPWLLSLVGGATTLSSQLSPRAILGPLSLTGLSPVQMVLSLTCPQLPHLKVCLRLGPESQGRGKTVWTEAPGP